MRHASHFVPILKKDQHLPMALSRTHRLVYCLVPVDDSGSWVAEGLAHCPLRSSCRFFAFS